MLFSVPRDSLYPTQPGHHTGVAGPFSSINSCNGNLNATYNPCIGTSLRTRTTYYEGTGTSNTNAPWVQIDSTYDDVDPAHGYVYASTYHNLLQNVTTSSNAPTFTKKMSYQVTDQTANGIIYYDVNKVSHSEVDDVNGHVWECQDATYDEGRPSGVPAPAAGLSTTQTSHSDCSSSADQTSSALASYTGFDQYGNPVATVDAFGAAHSSLYSSSGCTLTGAPTIMSSAWTKTHYTACTGYDASHYEALPVQNTNVYRQTDSTAYDVTQGDLPGSGTNENGQTTSSTYSYDSNGNSTVRTILPGAVSSYTSQSINTSLCIDASALPCIETDSNDALYPGAVKRIFYDNQGRQVETRTPLDSLHDTIVFTLYDDAHNTVFTSVPFRVANGTTWLDPNGAHDETGSAPGGTVVASDALGRTMAKCDPIVSVGGTGISCPNLTGVWNSCISYGLGSARGDSAVYHYAASTDGNSHLSVSFTDALGRGRYAQLYSTGTSITSNITKQTQTQYNVLNKPTSVIVTDAAPQSGQTTTSVTSSATYDDMGRVTTTSDPDQGNHSFTYDADGRVLTNVSGSHTVGTSYDLLGRVGCVQDAAPTTNGSGACSSGSNALTRNTYDTNILGTAGSTDFPIGYLTQSVNTTYYPDGTSSAATEQYQYDQRGRTTADRLQITVPSGWSTTLPTYQKTQSYNDDNQPMTTQTKVGSNPGYTFSQSYDGTTGILVGLSNTTVGNSSLISQSYDLHDQVMGLNFASSTGTQLVNDHFSYDQDQRPLSTTATWSANNTNFFSKSLTYDAVGNVLSANTSESAISGQSNSGGGESENFCYDEENRLVWAGNSGTQPGAGNGTCGATGNWNSLNGASYSSSYSYTHLGQIWQGPLNGTGSNLQYLYCNSTHPHQVTGLYAIGSTCSNKTNTSYSTSYDSWGNETTRSYNGTSATLSYDVLNELVEWNAGSTNRAWYAYGASAERTVARSITSSGTSLTVYAFGLEEHVYNGSGSNVGNTYYYSLDGRLIGKFDGTNTQYYLTDALGSVLSTFSNGATTTSVQGNQTYGPYGNKLSSAGSMGTAKGFTGQYSDPTGLDYYNARYYDPVIGRFLSADVVQSNLQGMDPYAYVSDNPETWNDPTGQCGGFLDVGCNIQQGLNNTWNATKQVGTTVGKAVGQGADFILGISSSIQDVHTLFDSKASAWDKVFAGADLAFNVVSDVAMVSGIGEAVKTVSTVAKLGGKLLVDVGKNLAKDDAKKVVEDEFSHVAAQSFDDAAKQGVKTATQDAAKTATQDVTQAACGGGLSFVFATKVATAQGEQTIGSLKVGQKVWSYNPQTQKMELQPILHVWINHDNDLVDLTITSTVYEKKNHGDQQVNEVIHTNKKHPFLTQEAGFVQVADLNVGMHVVEADGSVGMITSWTVVPGAMTMYNLEVAQDHTFTVGDGQWAVHNCPASGTSGNSSGAQRGNQFHYDMTSGGPPQLQQMYPTTEFQFTPRGPAGADVHVVGGDHPSNTSVYPGSTWYPGSDYGDFKPNSWKVGSQSKFNREIRTGKLPVGTVPIWYDPIGYVISSIG